MCECVKNINLLNGGWQEGIFWYNFIELPAYSIKASARTNDSSDERKSNDLAYSYPTGCFAVRHMLLPVLCGLSMYNTPLMYLMLIHFDIKNVVDKHERE